MKQITIAFTMLTTETIALFFDQYGICLVCYFIGIVICVELVGGGIIKQFIREVKDGRRNIINN